MMLRGIDEHLPEVRPEKNRDKQLQKQLFGGVALLTGLGASLATYAILHEPMKIQLEQLTIRLPHAKGRLPTNGLRILHLSDTHFQGLDGRERNKIERVRQLTAGLEYDLLVHTGDFWHTEMGLENLLGLLDSVPSPRLGSYGVLGNHDYTCYSHSDMLTRNWARYQRHVARTQNGHVQNGHIQNGHQTNAFNHLVENVREAYRFAQFFLNGPFELKRVYFNDVERLRQALLGRGMEVLHNHNLHIRHKPGQTDGVDLMLAGIDDVAEGSPNLQEAIGAIDPDEPTILLSHNPDVLEDPASRRADIILSGHTHGGQIVLPFVGAAHTHSEHLKRHEAAGYMRRGKTHVFVSRGIGEGIPLRFGASPQIALITVVG